MPLDMYPDDEILQQGLDLEIHDNILDDHVEDPYLGRLLDLNQDGNLAENKLLNFRDFMFTSCNTSDPLPDDATSENREGPSGTLVESFLSPVYQKHGCSPRSQL